MKCFHIKDGVVVPGIPVQNNQHQPVVVFGNHQIQLSDDYISNCPTDRIRRCDFYFFGQQRCWFEPESEETKDECLLFIETKQTAGAINVAIDGMVGTKDLYFNDKQVQTALQVLDDTVVYSNALIAVKLKKGQELTVHVTFTQRIQRPWTWSIREIIARFRSGPLYVYPSMVSESYSFDGDSVNSTIANLS